MTEEDTGVTFTISEAAKFFEKSPQWLHWRERTPVFSHKDGTPIIVKRSESGRREYTLGDLEEINEALYRWRRHTKEQYKQVKARIEAFKTTLEEGT